MQTLDVVLGNAHNQSMVAYIKGNKGGPGRKPLVVERAYLEATISRVPVSDWLQIVDVAVAHAKQGNRHAREWLSKYLLPNPNTLAGLLEEARGDNEIEIRIMPQKSEA